MKKFFAEICAAVVFAGCSAESAEGPARKPEPAQGGEARPIASSIFGRKVEYNAYTPAEGLSPPIPSGEIEDILRIEKRLYFLGDGAIFALDTENGESERLIETAAPMFATHGGRLYTYSPEEAVLREYDPSGGLLSEAELEIEGADSVEALAVTDGYFVFTCKIAGQIYVETQIFVYSRDSLEQTAAKSAPRAGVRLFPYKGDELLQIAEDGVFGAPILGAFDAKTAKSRKIRELSLGADPAVAYSPKTDTAIVFGCAEALWAEGEQPCEISGIVPEEEQYPKLESSEGRFAEWRCRPIEIIFPIFEARNKVLSGGGELSSTELKKLAREAAAEVAMRMGE